MVLGIGIIKAMLINTNYLQVKESKSFARRKRNTEIIFLETYTHLIPKASSKRLNKKTFVIFEDFKEFIKLRKH